MKISLYAYEVNVFTIITNLDELFDFWIDDADHEFSGWDFSYLEDRISTSPLDWSYPSEVIKLIRNVDSALDMETGGGEFLASLEPLPAKTVATEGYLPNIPIAKLRLEPIGVKVIEHSREDALPFSDSEFELVTNRHGAFDPDEVYRVLTNGGIFVTQQVGMEDYIELNDLLEAGPPEDHDTWNASFTSKQLQNVGFTISKQKECFPISRVYDIGALIYYLGIISWQIPDFSVEKYEDKLIELHQKIEEKGYLDVHSHRFLVIAKKSV